MNLAGGAFPVALLAILLAWRLDCTGDHWTNEGSVDLELAAGTSSSISRVDVAIVGTRSTGAASMSLQRDILARAIEVTNGVGIGVKCMIPLTLDYWMLRDADQFLSLDFQCCAATTSSNVPSSPPWALQKAELAMIVSG